MIQQIFTLLIDLARADLFNESWWYFHNIRLLISHLVARFWRLLRFSLELEWYGNIVLDQYRLINVQFASSMQFRLPKGMDLMTNLISTQKSAPHSM